MNFILYESESLIFHCIILYTTILNSQYIISQIYELYKYTNLTNIRISQNIKFINDLKLTNNIGVCWEGSFYQIKHHRINCMKYTHLFCHFDGILNMFSWTKKKKVSVLILREIHGLWVHDFFITLQFMLWLTIIIN